MKTFLSFLHARINQVSLVCLLLIIPLLLFPYGIFPFIAVGLALLLLIWHWVGSHSLRIRLEDIPLVILSGMALLGFLISIDRSLSFPRLWGIFLGLIIFLILRRSLYQSLQTSKIAIGLSILGLGMAGVGLLGTNWNQVRLFDFPALYDSIPTLIRGLPNSREFFNQDLIGPRMVGITMGILAPVFLPMLAWRNKPWMRVLATFTFLVMTSILLMTQTISGILALLAGTFIVLLFVSRKFLLLLPVGLVVFIMLVTRNGYTEFWTNLLSLNDVGGIAVLLRLDIWSRAWAMIRDMPFTGIGLNTFPLIQSQYYVGYIIGPEPDAHNLLLQTVIDLGLPGLIAFLWFILTWFVQLLKQVKNEVDHNKRLLMMGAMAGVVAYLGHGVIDALMLGSKPTFMVWVLLGVGAGLTSSSVRNSKPTYSKWALVCLALPLLMGIFTLCKPSSIYMNLGALQTHKLLSPFPEAQIRNQEDAEIAKTNLEKALDVDSSLRQAHLLLARIESNLGKFASAERHYEKRVALDMQDPTSTYDPAKQLRQMILAGSPSDPASELDLIYHNWNNRFPNRSEGYLLRSILARQYLEAPETAKAFLEAGIKAEAKPMGLLEYVLRLN